MLQILTSSGTMQIGESFKFTPLVYIYLFISEISQHIDIDLRDGCEKKTALIDPSAMQSHNQMVNANLHLQGKAENVKISASHCLPRLRMCSDLLHQFEFCAPGSPHGYSSLP